MTVESSAAYTLVQANALSWQPADPEDANESDVVLSFPQDELAVTGIHRVYAAEHTAEPAPVPETQISLAQIIVTEEARKIVSNVVWRLASNREDIEDHVQSVITQVLSRDADVLLTETEWTRYVRRMTRNFMIDEWRKRTASGTRREDLLLGEFTHDYFDMPELIADDFSDSVCSLDEVRQAFDLLTPTHRQAIYLYYYQNMSTEEISEALGIPLGTAKSRITYGKRQLHDLMTGAKHHALVPLQERNRRK